MFDDLALFVAVADHGGFARAAEALGVPPATLSRRIRKLEEDLDCQLLHRSAHRVALTTAGESYYARCQPLLAELQQATGALDETLHGLRGRITVLAPVNLAKAWMGPAWLRFMTLYPDVRLHLKLSNVNYDLFAEPFDLALRAGEQTDSGFICRRIAGISTVLVAAPKYVAAAGAPAHPRDLAAHRLIVADPLGRWSFTHRVTGETVVHEAAGVLVVDEMELVTQAAVDGQGILFLPRPIVADALADGRLVRMLPEWETPERDIYLVWPNRDFVPARVRALIDALTEYARERAERDAAL
jgi:LysR family transcriptional regulator AphB